MNNFSAIAREVADDIIKSQKKKMEQAVEYVAQRVSRDWEREARNVMDAYYSDYRSNLYNRTGELKDIITPVMERVGDSYIAGMRFDFGKMNHGELPKFSEYAIFENFMYGAHGNEDYTTKTGKQVTRNVHFTNPYARMVLDNYYRSYDAKIDSFWQEALLKF